MRLLKIDETGGLSFTEDLLEINLPQYPYAILSHTWQEGHEITFDDFVKGTGKDKTGYKKIFFCAEQTTRNGLRFFWVDTCCIDKSNAVELQHAINSMYRWYQNAVRCFTYLVDVPDLETDTDWELAFRSSRWFTRGWTLQELLAPKAVEFFSKDGRYVGSKDSLQLQIWEITGIPIKALEGKPLTEFTFTEVISWADQRNTRYEEDKVYSLLGMFGVFMPVNYGEGKEYAFRRLQEEIEKTHKGKNPSLLELTTDCIRSKASRVFHQLQSIRCV
jgi:Heterokaryon incompatibility protein (HET)